MIAGTVSARKNVLGGQIAQNTLSICILLSFVSSAAREKQPFLPPTKPLLLSEIRALSHSYALSLSLSLSLAKREKKPVRCLQ